MPENLTLLERAEAIRRDSLSGLNAKQQAKLGQFFTPSEAAVLIASMPQLPNNGALRVLDPGAGSGALTAALVARLLSEASAASIHVVVLETDELVLPALRATIRECQEVAAASGVRFTAEVVQGDYLVIAEQLGAGFDLVIMNPPYAKISASSVNRDLMLSRGVEAPNLYAAFMSLAVLNLRDGGQLVAITPRSFANGVYFEQFRKKFLDVMTMTRIHIFESRSTVFSDTGVLQENIITLSTKLGLPSEVVLSVSTGHKDEVVTRTVPYSEVLSATDKHRFIRIPSSANDTEVVSRFVSLPSSLEGLGVRVSTGRVVDFRSRDNLTDEPIENSFPMVYPASIKAGAVRHPVVGAKPQWFHPLHDGELKLLVPTGVFVLVKRFSAKEEKRRLVAGIWSPSANRSGPVAFDNKLNFLHIDGAGLDLELASGLSLWLNSTIVDTYFRTFSGHTQVNATDLRNMRFPNADDLRKLGTLGQIELPDQESIDSMVESIVFANATVAA